MTLVVAPSPSLKHTHAPAYFVLHVQLSELGEDELRALGREYAAKNPFIREIPAASVSEELTHQSSSRTLPELGRGLFGRSEEPFANALSQLDSAAEDSGTLLGANTRISLYESLLAQARLESLPLPQARALEVLINEVGTHGYLCADPKKLALEHAIPGSDVDQALATLHSFDPPGVGARTLSECLLIQLSRLRNRNKVAEKIVSSHLHDLPRKNFRLITQELGVSRAEVSQAYELILTLNPRPGRGFDPGEFTPLVSPTMHLEYSSSGEALISFTRPPLTFSKVAKSDLAAESGSLSPDETLMLRQWQSAANSFAYWTSVRYNALLELVHRLSEAQAEYLSGRSSYPSPLIMEEIAEKMGLHQSTISRLVRGKSLHAPIGIVELHTLFVGVAIEGNNGESLTAKRLADEIPRACIRLDNPSDQAVTDYLEERGIKLARRTVNLYRAKLRILREV